MIEAIRFVFGSCFIVVVILSTIWLCIFIAKSINHIGRRVIDEDAPTTNPPEHINCRSVLIPAIKDPRAKEFASFYNEHPIQFFIAKKPAKFKMGDVITISHEDHLRRYSIHTIGKISDKIKYYVEEI